MKQIKFNFNFFFYDFFLINQFKVFYCLAFLFTDRLSSIRLYTEHGPMAVDL